MNNLTVAIIGLIILIMIIIFAMCIIFSYLTSQIKITNDGTTDINALEARNNIERITVMLWLYFLTFIVISAFIFGQYDVLSKYKPDEIIINKQFNQAQISVLVYVLAVISFIFIVGLMALSIRV